MVLFVHANLKASRRSNCWSVLVRSSAFIIASNSSKETFVLSANIMSSIDSGILSTYNKNGSTSIRRTLKETGNMENLFALNVCLFQYRLLIVSYIVVSMIIIWIWNCRHQVMGFGYEKFVCCCLIYLLALRLCSFLILLISSLVGLRPRNCRPFLSSFPVKTPSPSKSNRLYIAAISEKYDDKIQNSLKEIRLTIV